MRPGRDVRLARDVVVAEPFTDSALVARCAGGDEAALAELYDRYASVSYGLAMRIVRDAALAEDVVQEAFLAVWRGAARFDESRSKVSTWLLSLVHHKAVDLVRREEARPKPAGEDAPERPDRGRRGARRRARRRRRGRAPRARPADRRRSARCSSWRTSAA